MKKTFTLLITFTALSALAQEDFSVNKERLLKSIDQRIATMTNHKACVEKATDKEALRACAKAHRLEAMKQKQERKSKKQ